MQEPLNYILQIIENPDAKKGYLDLKKYYEKFAPDEAAAIDYLIQKRYVDHDNIDTK